MTDNKKKLHVVLISLHGLIRAESPELGRDADTGGQIKYVLEVAAEMARHSEVRQVDLLTRQIVDDRVGPEYARLEESIAPGARIIRIPFGPKRYIKKEALWPHLDVCVDQTLAYFKRTGLPDIIHAHYADAGYVGAQLARLLAIPFVFTGHSLGRVKRQRMLVAGKDDKDLESRYRFTTRLEAEEMALETASMVVASTNQEVEQQYAIYEHYVPDRMEVIPPGVDLTAYFPPQPNAAEPAIAAELRRFLRDPDRPMILTMARPDERKNLEMLVRVYGQSKELQSLANLVLVMGTRDDLRELSSAQRRVVNNILTLIDVYDLYGKVAYPKQHAAADVPELYRLATLSRGVFINPALTEPFGLTLLEAAGSGLPIVATNDGGPQDIVANCQNGLLTDPLDAAAIERALLRTLTEADSWNKWSTQGIRGVHAHYTWKSHVDRYLRDIGEILEQADTPTLRKTNAARRLPEFDRLVITDLDNTLTGDPDGLQEFIQRVQEAGNVGFGIATGRSVDDAMPLIRELALPSPDVLVTSVGTELYYGPHLHLDRSWRKQIPFNWNRRGVEEVLAEVPGLFIQAGKEQSEFKISYQIDPELAPSLGKIRRVLRQAGLRTKVVLSLGIYLDVIPLRGGSDLAIRHLLYKWGFSPEHLLVAGDSGNDEGMLRGRTLGVVVGNHGPELQKLRGLPRIYFAEAEHARGILEGIDYYNFFGHITIPNDWTS
ncbi:MAG: HAD-IIB family hydrolase [Planctomycetales bacterium]|nr:HAD-IIB family hydrolase [Planctomycetales bacterium]